ncbi:MAG: DEAD/DEAH box helicase [Candidatus Dadabacteria bacterium]|nr:MAG: DEAD/DEAH box helicase [Candidatus Dadabacteria bacterium]
MTQGARIERERKRLLAGIGAPKEHVFKVDDFQRDAIESVVAGNDTLVVAPTGAGKTYIATEAIDAALRLGGRAVYTTPLKALSNTKFTELKSRFEPEFSVGLLTGDRKIEGNADVVVATTEIYRNELYSLAGDYSVVVLDEVHFIADPYRGPVWEESIILSPHDSTLLMLSASISNPQEISEWLEEVRGKPCTVIIKEKRPVELRYAFLHPELGIIPLRNARGGLLKEVAEFYRESRLDRSGMKLKGGRFARKRSQRKAAYARRSGRGKRSGRQNKR